MIWFSEKLNKYSDTLVFVYLMGILKIHKKIKYFKDQHTEYTNWSGLVGCWNQQKFLAK